MALEAGLRVDHLPLAAQAAAGWDDVLGVASFGGDAGSLQVSAVPLADVHMPVLAADLPVLGAGGGLCEIWRTPQPLESGHRWRVHYRHGADILFGCISVTENEGLHAATADSYREIFATLDELAYPYLLRVWNYLPQINLEVEGSERYWQFNSGRRATLLATGRDVAGTVPAACALGSVTDSPLVVYFLACREPPTVIENPRQISAYEYPQQYGPKPAFSRASVVRESDGGILFISGTASIVGHETMHLGDVAAQTRETLTNIEALLDEANRVSGRRHGHSRFGLESLAYKIYIRNPADLPVVQSQLHSALGSRAQVLYLQADVCRPDLLVEIEATGRETACD